MNSRTKRYRNHYGFKTEQDFLTFVRMQAADDLGVSSIERQMLLDLIIELTQIYAKLRVVEKVPTAVRGSGP
jgi:hypothetical protein